MPQTSKTKVNKLFALLFVFLLAMPTVIVSAEAPTNIPQAYIFEQTLTVFTNDELNADTLRCMVSNQNADITKTGRLSDEYSLTKTTVLVDVSTSMPSDLRGNVIAALKKLIEDKSTNEEYKIIAFGEELNTIQDYTSDRYDLAAAIDKIVFDGNQSKIYDAIYNTIPQINPVNSKVTFYRTIVITDGVDDTESGITKEELFLKLQNEHYPIDVVEVSREEAAESKDLSAIVRMSNGRRYSLNPNTDVASLAQALSVSGFSFFEAMVPAALLDGTTRQVDINDGVLNASLDVKFLVFNAPVNPELTANSEPTPEPTPEPAPDINTGAESKPATTLASTPNEATAPPVSDEPSNTNWIQDNIILVVVASVVLILLIVLVIILVVKPKKNKEDAYTKTDTAIDNNKTGYIGKTEFVFDEEQSPQFTIKLCNPNDPSKSWTLPIQGELLVGRDESCAIRFEDKSVSHQQCKIVVKGGGLAVEHLGSTNKTSLNGSKVTGSFPLQSGDTLKFGREALHIDYIQSLSSPIQNNEPQKEQPQRKRDTESIF